MPHSQQTVIAIVDDIPGLWCWANTLNPAWGAAENQQCVHMRKYRTSGIPHDELKPEVGYMYLATIQATSGQSVALSALSGHPIFIADGYITKLTMLGNCNHIWTLDETLDRIDDDHDANVESMQEDPEEESIDATAVPVSQSSSHAVAETADTDS